MRYILRPSFLAGILLGTIPLFSIKLSELGINTNTQVITRLTVAIIFLSILAKLKKIKLTAPKPTHLLSGLLIFLIFSTYLFALDNGVDPSSAIIIMNTYPIFVILFSTIFLGKQVRQKEWLLAITIIGGVFLLVANDIDLEKFSLFGMSLVVINSISYALYIMTAESTLKQPKNNFTPYTLYSLSIGLIISLAWSLLNNGIQINFPSNLNIEITLLFLGIGIFSTGLPYILISIDLLKKNSIGSSINLLVEILVVILIDTILLRNHFGYEKIAGMAIILFGIILYNKEIHKPHSKE